MGRPLGIQDADIDVEVQIRCECHDTRILNSLINQLPMDVDVEELSDTILLSLSEKHSTTAAASPPNDHIVQSPNSRPITSMTSALHIIKCRQIESDIQRLIYRVDRTHSSLSVMEDAMKLLGRLDKWKANIPQKSPDGSSSPCCTPEWFSWRYFEVSLYLLRPLTVSSLPADPLLSRLAYAAAGSVEAQRRMHQTPPVSLSLSALHSVFLSGLTLLHCLHVNPRIMSPIAAGKAIRACSNTLFLYAQYFTAAESFRDAFEDIANACLDAADEKVATAVTANSGAGVRDGQYRTSERVATKLGQNEGLSTTPLLADQSKWGHQLDDMTKLMTDGQRDSFLVSISPKIFVELILTCFGQS